MLKRTLQSFLLSAVMGLGLTDSTMAQDGFWADLFDHRSDCVQLTASEEFLFMSRDVRLDHGTQVIGGPDANVASFENSDINYETGYRIGVGVEGMEHRLEVVFAEYGDWISRDAGRFTTGLSFENGAGWPAASNVLNAGTFFSPINTAAVAEADEFEGLGPNAAFADAAPTYTRFYESSLQDLQVNLISNDPCAEIRVGIGYRNLQLDESAGFGIAGTMRAIDVAGPNGGLSHATLTGAGGLTFIGGTPDGFQDQTVVGGADLLTLDWQGSTDNQLNGFQMVVDACLIDSGTFDVTMIAKAGAFHNHARGRVRERYTGVNGNNTSTYGRDFADSKDVVAFAGSVGVKAGWNMTDHLRLIGGYEGLFMSGLALAPEQGGGVNGNTYEVETDGNVIVHGATAGIELTY